MLRTWAEWRRSSRVPWRGHECSCARCDLALRLPQGEDVVAGIRTPQPISRMAEDFPEAYEDLRTCTSRLERHMKDMQDCEFTVMEGRLFMLQTRNGKRTGKAALRIAKDMVAEGVVTPAEAVCMVEPAHMDQLLHPQARPAPVFPCRHMAAQSCMGQAAVNGYDDQTPALLSRSSKTPRRMPRMSSLGASRRPRGRRWGRRCSQQRMRRQRPRRGGTSSCCESRRSRMTWAACTPRRASSRPEEA